MARKTVLRRCSKAAPTGSDLAQLLARDDEEPEYPQADNFPAPPARPRRDDFIDLGEEGSEEETGYNDDGPSPGEEGMHSDGVYTLVDPDGQFQDFETATDAANAFGGMLGDLVPRGERMLKAAWEDNSPLLVKLEAEDATAFRFVIDAYDAALRLVPSRSAPRTQTREQAKPSPAPATSEPKQTTQPAPAQAAPPSPERSYKIGPVPTKADGKPDYRAWAWGLFIVQVRKETDPIELAWLIGENDEDIQAYKRSAPPIDRNRFQVELDKISAALQAQSQGT